MLNAELKPATSDRVSRCQALRTETAGSDAFVAAPPQIDNGDEALYADKSGTYTKGILQTGIGLVDLAAYKSFKAALSSGAPADFEKIVLGGARTLNGPQGGLAFYLDCLDGDQFTAPPAPTLASEAYATELVELYLGVPAAGYRVHHLSHKCRGHAGGDRIVGDAAVPRAHVMPPITSRRDCCFVAVLLERRLGPTSRSFCFSRQRSARCLSLSNTSPTKRISTS